LALALGIHEVFVDAVALVLVKDTVLGIWHAVPLLFQELVLVLAYASLGLAVESLVMAANDAALGFVLGSAFYALAYAFLLVVLLIRPQGVISPEREQSLAWISMSLWWQ
jgi:hypothetical protein